MSSNKKFKPVLEVNQILNEDIKLGKKDKGVLDAFSDKKSAESKYLSTDGKTLDGNWMGGSNIAKRKGNKIEINDIGSRAQQTVVKALRKIAPANDFLKEQQIIDEWTFYEGIKKDDPKLMGKKIDWKKVIVKAPTRDGKGDAFVIMHRDTAGMPGTQDKFQMVMVDSAGRVILNYGSHPSLNGAKKFAKNKGLMEGTIVETKVSDGMKVRTKGITGKGLKSGKVYTLKKAAKFNGEDTYVFILGSKRAARFPESTINGWLRTGEDGDHNGLVTEGTIAEAKEYKLGDVPVGTVFSFNDDHTGSKFKKISDKQHQGQSGGGKYTSKPASLITPVGKIKEADAQIGLDYEKDDAGEPKKAQAQTKSLDRVAKNGPIDEPDPEFSDGKRPRREQFAPVLDVNQVNEVYTWRTTKSGDGFKWSVVKIEHGKKEELVDSGEATSRAIAVSAAKKSKMKFKKLHEEANEPTVKQVDNSEIEDMKEKDVDEGCDKGKIKDEDELISPEDAEDQLDEAKFTFKANQSITYRNKTWTVKKSTRDWVEIEDKRGFTQIVDFDDIKTFKGNTLMTEAEEEIFEAEMARMNRLVPEAKTPRGPTPKFKLKFPKDIDGLTMGFLYAGMQNGALQVLDDIEDRTGSITSPIYMQVMEGWFKVENQLKKHLKLKGPEALDTFMPIVLTEFLPEAPFLRTLYRKYKLNRFRY